MIRPTLLSKSIARPFYNYYIEGQTRGPSFPYITGDTFRELGDHVLDEENQFDPKAVNQGDLVFVGTAFLSQFFHDFHPFISNQYFLMTNNSDIAAPGRFFIYLTDRKILLWFGINVEIKHPKMIPIPIGVRNRHHCFGNIAILEEKKKIDFHKEHLLYLNFYVSTWPIERGWLKYRFSRTCYTKIGEPKHFRDYLDDMKRSKFILSPRGMGLDCFRTWEALCLGNIPIVKSGTLDEIYENLPVLIVKKWQEINELFLEKKYEEMKNQTFDLNRLYFPYWKEKIEQICNKLLEK